MNYVTASAINLSCIVPPELAANNISTQYHCELYNVSTGVRKNVAASSFVAAVLPNGNNPGSSGTVGFTGLPCVVDGAYVLSVFYADSADLDVASITKVGTAYMNKVTAVTALTA